MNHQFLGEAIAASIGCVLALACLPLATWLWYRTAKDECGEVLALPAMFLTIGFIAGTIVGFYYAVNAWLKVFGAIG